MQFRMKNLDQLSLAEMERILSGSRKVAFQIENAEEKYKLIAAVLKAQRYAKLDKLGKGVVRRFLAVVTATSRAQLTRLIARWLSDRKIVRRPAVRPEFHVRYTPEDTALLAATDAAHEDLSGPALRHILHREFTVFGNRQYQRLAGISVSHLYNLRNSSAYRKHRVKVQHTQASKVSIGERRKPDPKGRPGFLRIDTVHQGHKDGQPGLYFINSVDTVTQWQAIGCVETISERHMLPVLEAMLHQYPFRILGFHSDNGSEFLNERVASMLNKLLVEFTKSRANRSTDNALIEGKNGSVIRKHIGYGFIASEHADQLQRFLTAQFNPYLNFHRPCGFAVLVKSGQGRVRRRYPADGYRTPFEKLSSLPDWQQHLKPGITQSLLGATAAKHSDTEAAKLMQKAKLGILRRIRLYL
jgi:transposase InsO family protein